MCRIRGRPGDAPGNSLGGVWSPCFIMGLGIKGIPAWVLLADGIARSRGVGLEMQRMSEICPPNSSVGISIENYSVDLALCCVGPGHGRSI
jgi:hypothetical protein